jgi:uncharacterized protein (DUF58 family)
MRTATERLLLRLEWRVIRRLEGRVQGSYRTVRQGTGFDLAGLRYYVEGDDARRIDWNSTARLGEPISRVFNEERELTVWLVLDCSPSMAVGPPGRGKRDVLAELTLLLGLLFNRSGNRIGALLYDPPLSGPLRGGKGARQAAPRARVVPPGSGRRHVLRIGAELQRAASGARDAGGATTDLAVMLETIAKLARRRSLIVVISDFIGDGEWTAPLRRLARRHEVVALRVTDVADDELPAAGLIVIEDAETGEQLVIDSADPLLRARLDAGVTARDASLAAGMRQAGVPLHRIGTDSDLGRSLIEVVSETRRRPG